MPKRILLINSDLAKNRGDRAIAEGIITLTRQCYPDSVITGLSQFPERDREWYGIDFLNMDFQSLSPSDLARLYKAAKRHDIILWGGGEILKDYTNKAALWYWVVKMTVLSVANPNLYGAYQGIGPTKAPLSKRLIVFVTKRCKAFIVRDDESRQKLIEWGANAGSIHGASDPAVLPIPAAPSTELQQKLLQDIDINQAFLEDFICIGPRDWFHYKPGGIIPYKYKKRLDALFGRTEITETEQHRQYVSQLEDLVRTLVNERRLRVLFVPMHMEESDSALCQRLAEVADDPSLVRVADKDTLSPTELRCLISQAKAMIGFRLHSNIIGVSANVPSMNIYYVDKGRVFFDQIGQSKYAMPIESVLDDSFVKTVAKLFDELLSRRVKIRKEIKSSTAELRGRVTTTFKTVLDDAQG